MTRVNFDLVDESISPLVHRAPFLRPRQHVLGIQLKEPGRPLIPLSKEQTNHSPLLLVKVAVRQEFPVAHAFQVPVGVPFQAHLGREPLFSGRDCPQWEICIPDPLVDKVDDLPATINQNEDGEHLAVASGPGIALRVEEDLLTADLPRILPYLVIGKRPLEPVPPLGDHFCDFNFSDEGLNRPAREEPCALGPV